MSGASHKILCKTIPEVRSAKDFVHTGCTENMMHAWRYLELNHSWCLWFRLAVRHRHLSMTMGRSYGRELSML